MDMWKNILRTILFLTIFTLLFLMVTPVFVPKDNSYYSGIHEESTKGFLAEPENSIDVFFIGDSEVHSTFIPLRIWEQYGITSYGCGTGAQVMYQTYSYLEHAFKVQSPKIVILEANILFRDFTIDGMISHTAEEFFPFLRYHDRWKTLQPEDWTNPVDFRTLVRDKGYTYRSRAIPASTESYMIPSDEIYPMHPLNQWYFHRIHALCRQHGAQLIVVSAPSPVNWDYYYHNGVVKLLEGLDVPYLDMNLMSQEIPIDWNTESYDGGDHLNYYGACKTTDYIGAYLWQTGLFEDKRESPEYEHWNSALDEFYALVETDQK